MSEYNVRQYGRMLDQIHDFESGRIDLTHLISGLKSLLHALEEADVEWKSKFQNQWGVLEEVYAVALDRNRELDKGDLQLIGTAVQAMKQLLSQVYAETS
jgi:hypothetical protein